MHGRHAKVVAEAPGVGMFGRNAPKLNIPFPVVNATCGIQANIGLSFKEHGLYT